MAFVSWLPIAPDSPYSLRNIPFGVISTSSNAKPRPAVAVGDSVIDLSEFQSGGGLDWCPEAQKHLAVFQKDSLNDFAALGRPFHRTIRTYLQDVLHHRTPFPEALKNNATLQAKCILAAAHVKNHLPLDIRNFTDFYGGMNHAINAGSLFRSRENAVNPNYHHLPEAYHSRASSVVVSGTPIHRPSGQVVKDDAPTVPHMEPSSKIDFELELGAIVCRGNAMGHPIPIDEAEEAISGFVMLNDWSARDIQRWEYVPLGPFNGKNFGTSISAWVVLADALEPFRKRGLERRNELLPYLRGREDFTYNLNLQVQIATRDSPPATVCSVNASDGLVYSFEQMLAHHTVTGCPMLVGDLLGSGTISGDSSSPESWGCLLERTQGGKQAVTLAKGVQRTWLEDGDTVTFTGWAGDIDTGLVGFGPCSGELLPALKFH